MSASPRSRGKATLASYTLDNLLRGAAQLDPHGAALAGHMLRGGARRR